MSHFLLTRLGIFTLLFIGIFAAPVSVRAEMMNEISQFGITWTFDKAYPAGRFANGDYWVVGPVTLTRIDPPSVTEGERTRNGSMINPNVGEIQGYDSSPLGPARYSANYDDSLNVAAGLNPENPLVVAPNSSLISTISHDDAGHRPQLSDAAVLTVLDKAAPEGSFRPPQTGSDKNLRWNVGQIDWSKLKALPSPPETPDLEVVSDRLERPWLVQNSSWKAGFIHPDNNQPPYGRDIALALADALLMVHLDEPETQKRELAIRLIQYGIDVYGAARGGAEWVGYGGHNQGRKMPMIFAGLMLNDPDILAFADGGTHFIFQEDQQTWIVAEEDVGRPLLTKDKRAREPYISEDVGVAEWGEQHSRQPNRDGRNWGAYYRRNVGHSTLGHAQAARLMGAEEIWNWPPFFLYADRYWELEKDVTSGTDAIKPFHRAMRARP